MDMDALEIFDLIKKGESSKVQFKEMEEKGTVKKKPGKFQDFIDNLNNLSVSTRYPDEL